jgi:hypothetical protein
MPAHIYGLVVSSLVASVVPGDTTLRISVTDQGLFPDPASLGLTGVYLRVLSTDGTVRESVLLSSRSGNILTVLRAQLGTQAQSFSFGARVELVLDNEPAEALMAFWGQFYALPRKSIVMWHGLVINIPSGWALCDGTGGTPDLRDRFLVGAEGDLSPGAMGGSLNWTTELGGVHDHGGTALASVDEQPVESDDSPDAVASPVTHAHEIPQEAAHAHSLLGIRPPYYAAVFIMKL